MYKEDLALNNRKGLICCKINQPTNQNYIYLTYMNKKDLALNNRQYIESPNGSDEVLLKIILESLIHIHALNRMERK